MNNTKTITDEQAKAELDKRASKISDNDVKKILDQESDLLSKVTGAGGPLGKLLDDVKTLFSMIKDYWNGDYREVPWTTIAAAAAALAYVLSPIDLIPDFIPVVGLIDDALVVTLCIKAIQTDLESYKAWTAMQSIVIK